jgi:flagella basal body P-ring formation protein FlgA
MRLFCKTVLQCFLALGVLGIIPAHAVTLSQEHLVSLVETHVKQQLKHLKGIADDPETTVSVQLLHVPGYVLDFPQLETDSQIQVEIASSLATTYSNRVLMAITMTPATGRQRKTGIPVSIQIKKSVWVVSNPIPAGSVIHQKDLKLERQEVSYHYPYVMGAKTGFGNYTAKVNLSPGQLLDFRKLGIAPDVTSNSPVRILFKNRDGMEITVPGIALTNGEIGQKIKVRQTVFMHKYYLATVVSKNRVLVEL